MNWFKRWTHAFHHLFNPHCTHCESLQQREREFQMEQESSRRVCPSCETLKTQLEFQNQLIRELTRPPENSELAQDVSEYKPIQPKHKPWSVKQAELEFADRKLAAELRQKKIEEITADNLDAEIEGLRNAKPA